ncbi:MAG: hypothetical protein KKG75_00610 [Nanoarchaeota archaeon]|nr:hypothetical protein [Nanoarchaeota archaeon]
MNKKGGSTLASKSGFYIIFLILFTFAVLYSVKFIEDKEVRRVDFFQLEDSVVINRVISCVSNDNFGEIDVNKFNEIELRKCLTNTNFNFIIMLDTVDDQKIVSIGDVGLDYRSIGRYVLVDNKKARIRAGYSKNVPE